MGIRGLTTFIHNRSHLYMEKYELHNCDIVIDGNSIACQLYRWHCNKSNDCFGGDYDKFSNVILNFFELLKQCNVTPYVIFDGGYEKRKLFTVISRMKNKIKSAEQLNSVTEGSISVFPLFLRETFSDIILKLGVKTVRCDYEGDTEIASIAKALNCPVLSYDSDYFIFDVQYIPFSTVELSVRKGTQKDSKQTYNYIYCEAYKIDKFLNSFGGLDKNNLPILAVLLGNDYVNRSVFSSFFNNLKIQKCRGIQNEQQKRIKSVIIWLQNETIHSAIRKVLSRYKLDKRKLIAESIENAVRGYYYVNSTLLEHLGISQSPVKNELNMNIEDAIKEADSAEGVLENESEQECSESDSENVISTMDFSKKNRNIPECFLTNFRKVLYPPSFMDILMQDKYYCIPQVEDGGSETSHKICFRILGAIHKILTNKADVCLTCIARNENGKVQKFTLDLWEKEVPSLLDIQEMDEKQRKNVLYNVLCVDKEFTDNLNMFPESLHLFLLSVKYAAFDRVLDISMLYALIICHIALKYLDKKVGFCRSIKVLEKKFAKIKQSPPEENIQTAKSSVKENLDNITYKDALCCLKTLIPYFHMDVKMTTNNRLFDRMLVHSMAQFQSCFLHIKYLNQLLNMPFPNFFMPHFFNGTFMYNVCTNFRKRTNLDNYMGIFLKDGPTVLDSFKAISSKIKDHIINNDNFKNVYVKGKKRRKRKQKNDNNVTVFHENVNISDEEQIIDPNNKFSILNIE